MITEEQREVNRILNRKARLNREKKTQEEIEKEEIEELFKTRIEFKQWVNVVRDTYVDLCDKQEIEPSIDWFINYCAKYES